MNSLMGLLKGAVDLDRLMNQVTSEIKEIRAECRDNRERIICLEKEFHHVEGRVVSHAEKAVAERVSHMARDLGFIQAQLQNVPSPGKLPPPE